MNGRRRPAEVVILGAACIGAALLGPAILWHGDDTPAARRGMVGATATAVPQPFAASGHLVSLPAEMKKLHGAAVPPVHEALWGFRRSGPVKKGILRYYTLLRTPNSEALFADERFRGQELHLTGRVFPETAVLEVHRIEWYRGGTRAAVYYWCEICSIRGLDPGPCACCQGEVELREEKVSATSGK